MWLSVNESKKVIQQSVVNFTYDEIVAIKESAIWNNDSKELACFGPAFD